MSTDFGSPNQPDGLTQLAALAEQLVELDKVVHAREVALIAAKSRLQLLSTKTIPQKIESLGIPIPPEGLTIPTRNGPSIRVKEEVHGSCSKANMPELVRWLDENGESGMVKRAVSLVFNREQSTEALELCDKLRKKYPMVDTKETVNANTLKAWVRRRLEDGENLPDVVSFEITRRAKVV